MARNIVPRSDKGADLGTAAKNWNNIYTDKLTLRGSDLQGLLDEKIDAVHFIEDQIVDGQTEKAPSQNAVYDALTTKTDKATLTTKGDLYVRDATGVTRLPVGADGEVLMADSSQAEGVAWSPPDDLVDFATPSEVTGVHTTGSITSGSKTMTVASATGIVAGMYVVGEGIVPGTTVATVSGTTVTLSANAGRTLSSKPVGFYVADKVLSPGLTAGMLCRAWVNFNGTGTVAIRAAMNVSSIIDNGRGDYTVNFATAMPDANYSPTSNAGYDLSSGISAQTTTSVSIKIWDIRSESFEDAAGVFLVVHR